MNRHRQHNNNSDPESYKSLLPEIANLLNMSVSSIEKYPADIQKALCNIYTDNYYSDQITIKQALGRVVQLNTETEKQIEQALVKVVAGRGGLCPKWVSPGFGGVPDRIILLPGGRCGLPRFL